MGPLLRLNVEAIIDNLPLTSVTSARKSAAGTVSAPTPEEGDGLWRGPMNQPAWELKSAFAVPWLFRLPVIRRPFAIRRYLRTQRGTRHIALVCGAFHRWDELYAAGRLLMELWLAMARAAYTCSRWARCSPTRIGGGVAAGSASPIAG